MWSNESEFDIEEAGENATKLVLLASAFKSGLFSALSEEKDIPALSHELGADGRALFIVLEALTSMSYVNKKNDRYIIADRARHLFIERGEDYMGGFLPHFLNIMKAWMALPEIIKGVKPEKEPRRPDIASFMGAMASRPDKIVEEVVDRCLKRKKDARSVLDLGGGPGKYSKAFINRGLSAAIYDTSPVIDFVSTELGLSGVKNLTLMKGDFTGDEFRKDIKQAFDIVFMGNICHIYSEEENRKIMKRVPGLLNPAGMIAIEDFVRGRSPKADLFAVNMLANSTGGNTWSEAQYRQWLKEAGFIEIEVADLLDKGKQLITAFRKHK
jgi:SAM-dependent methyltransferase